MQYSPALRRPPPWWPAGRRSWRSHPRLRWLPALLVALLPAALVLEVRTSALQALVFPRVAETLAAGVGPGPSPGALRFPETGPYDRRLGYARIPEWTERLRGRGLRVTAQARQPRALRTALGLGVAPPYAEKGRAGLVLEDRAGAPLLDRRRPRRTFESFAEIPPLVVESLLFLENRELLGKGIPTQNPAVEWDRLGHAVGVQLAGLASGAPGRGPGGSTLATQLEKVRHSPGGRTVSPLEKLRQMVGASLRAYREGPDTRDARRRIVLDYLNGVPLAAAPGAGEIFGLGDGLYAWYGAELEEVVALLEDPRSAPVEAGRALRRVVSLLVAERRPSDYLRRAPAALASATDATLRRLHEAGILEGWLRDAALAAETRPRAQAPPGPSLPPRFGEAARGVRSSLADALGLGFYALHRLDLRVRTTLDAAAAARVRERLRALEDPERARRAGLVGPRLLEGGGLGGLVVSLSLYEAGGDANRLRLQLDTRPGAFNVAEGARMDLGSTAKLRTLVHYLDVVAEIRARHEGASPERLRAAREEAAGDPITRFVLGELAARPGLPLEPLLEAALERRYSASSAERFFTGRAWHRFENATERFEGEHLTVREAFRHSVNLVFVRLMRDLRRHAVAAEVDDPERLLRDPDDPRRRAVLKRFVREDARRRLAALHARHRARGPAERLSGVLAAGGGRASTAPRHPLERWAARRLATEPGLSLEALVKESDDARRRAYGWLFRTELERARERRLRTVLERDAFRRIHARWARQGYPFERLVPSLATAIGASGERPAALAELLGIVANRGYRRPVRRVETLAFAEGTPYETRLGPGAPRPERVLAPEVAEAVRGLLRDAVQHGTARRARGAFTEAGLPHLRLAGKTGTAEALAKHGDEGASATAGTRAAAFAFLAGDRHYGVLTLHATGPESARMQFTSSLATQLLRVLATELAPVMEPEGMAPASASIAHASVRTAP